MVLKSNSRPSSLRGYDHVILLTGMRRPLFGLCRRSSSSAVPQSILPTRSLCSESLRTSRGSFANEVVTSTVPTRGYKIVLGQYFDSPSTDPRAPRAESKHPSCWHDLPPNLRQNTRALCGGKKSLQTSKTVRVRERDDGKVWQASQSGS